MLYLHGVKSGDYQATLGGLSVAAFFLFISWAKPLKRLAPTRPYTTVFNTPLLLSIMGQWLTHTMVLMAGVSLCVPYAAVDATLSAAAANITDPLETLTTEEATAAIRTLLAGGSWHKPSDESFTVADTIVFPSGATQEELTSRSQLDDDDEFIHPAPQIGVPDDDLRLEDVKSRLLAAKSHSLPENDASHSAREKPTLLEDRKFAPNIINTVVFLISTTQQAATFMINYTGAPFMQPLIENKGA